MIALRPMTHSDLPLVRVWLEQPHVARWWQDVEDDLEQYRQWVRGAGDRTLTPLTVLEDRRPVGWCEWYRWDADPVEEAAAGALPGECGIDYAIGDPDAVGRGLGTEMIAALVAEVRRHQPGCGILVYPEAANHASRRVLEKNGFALVEIRPVATEPNDNPMAIYRLGQESANRPRDSLLSPR